ncbi:MULTISPECIES: ABC transporter ATP-binding protein [Haloferax]|uniref:ABC-type D-xylose/L-arabinose transporter n=1 Tax=Haloferax massiliensis TaxID=1476858 RepID=A0A0D6JV74_9EURY|nr:MULTISPECIES: sn-glycerol-3-phosphate ABC transporter ATP-binding protein UgpC [Haloferax]MDS0241454.1 sn-glycerol-3-phosphate ABC transporter ATP-binding protein UgpC [Haloferax sp. S2CR25]MDS0444575.1 sn-glycerol-3-phosphate ABC transporter ATP-binding protein UgpC [Haloferax sp. S2CR25-2]CQR52070.1 sn-glycerol-3-phosphate import ATP-binding protein UgpC [Haloferax massiliensis]
MARVEFDNITKVFEDTSGPIVAVEELSLDIPDGEFVVFVGPSGCGKSTTLRMLAGLENITDGEIRLNGEPVNDVSPRDRDIAMVFQSYALYPHKTVRGNMGYGLSLSTDLNKEEVDRRVVEAAEMMGIEDLLDKKPGSLSGGQQQRVATGRAIVREPAVFLFDEPLSNLDAQLRKHMRTELSRIHSELGITTIYVTHDQEEAMTMADRIVILNDGQLQQVGSPKEVYYRPANTFVADFIGSPSMNFFDVDLEVASDGTGTLVGNGFRYSVSDSLVDLVGGEGEYVLSVRPENLNVDPSASGEKSFEATVDVVEVIGSDNFIYLDVAGKECRLRAPSETEPEEGDVITVTFEEDDLHLFDRNTEEALIHGHERAESSPKIIESEA